MSTKCDYNLYRVVVGLKIDTLVRLFCTEYQTTRIKYIFLLRSIFVIIYRIKRHLEHTRYHDRLWPATFSTSSTRFGQFLVRTTGPFSVITMSSSILTPIPKNSGGSCGCLWLMYTPRETLVLHSTPHNYTKITRLHGYDHPRSNFNIPRD